MADIVVSIPKHGVHGLSCWVLGRSRQKELRVPLEEVWVLFGLIQGRIGVQLGGSWGLVTTATCLEPCF